MTWDGGIREACDGEGMVLGRRVSMQSWSQDAAWFWRTSDVHILPRE